MKRPTEADRAKAWKRCEICKEQSPFLVRLDDHQVCVPCCKKAVRTMLKAKAEPPPPRAA
jgi:hypothetical protein